MQSHLDDLACQFFKLFAQYESTMKERGFFQKDGRGGVHADWDMFANKVAGTNFRNEVGDAANYILQNPPKKQVVNEDDVVVWEDVPSDDQSVQALFGHIRRMRNNLFHGAKFNGTWFDPDRSKLLLERGLTILKHYRKWLGNAYHTGQGVAQDNAEAVKWFRRAAEQGDAKAQSNLGFIYGEGLGVSQDDAQALKWFRKAAEQGDARAQYNLGLMYDKGRSVPQDDAEAMKWWRKAAEQGNAGAQFNLGAFYANGQCVPQDYVLAHMWLSLAGAQGQISATKNRDLAAKRMTPAQIAEAQKLAREWKPR